MSRGGVLLLGVLALACGPTVGLDESSTTDDTGTTPTATTATTEATTEPATTQPGSDGTTEVTTADSGSDDDGGYEDDDGGTGCTFTCPDPPPPTPPPGGGGGVFECDLMAQDCPEGEKCMPWANDGGGEWNATRCSPVADNPDTPGQPCTVEGSGTSGIDTCELGVVCWHVDPETNMGVCEALCSGDAGPWPCEGPGQSCVPIDDLVPLCIASCDPVMPDCAMDEGCQIVLGSDAFICQPAGAVAVGEVCTVPNECEPGALCAYGQGIGCGRGPGEGCCAEACEVGAPGGCPGPGQVCTAWIPFDSPPEYAHIGVCAPG